MTDELLSGLDPEMLALLWADESANPIIKKQNHTEGPLSFSQHRLWILQQLDPEMTAYNMPSALLLEGTLNKVRLEAAFNQLIDKHAVFRTQYLTINDEPIQRIVANSLFELETIALDIPADNEQSYLQNETVKNWFNRPFDLASGALLRAAMVTVSTNRNIVLIDYHHIASDAWSNAIILQDLANAYVGKKLAVLDTSYLDFAYWQNDYLTCDDSQTTKDYWLTYLSGDIQPLRLPIDFKQPTTQNFTGACSSIVFNEQQTNALKRFCKAHEVTPFMVLLATWQILLSRYSNQSDFAIGVPTASRNQAELQQIVGFFVNTQIYKAQLSSQLSVKQLIEKIRKHTLNILEQEQLPLEWLLNNLEITRANNRSPLFQVLFDYKTDESLSSQMDDIVITPFVTDTISSKFELELNVLMAEDQANISLNYQTALFTQSTIENLLEDFNHVLSQVISNPLSHIGNLTLKSQGLVLINESCHKYTASVHQLIEQQVELTPNATALVFEEKQLSYAELNQQANQLAHYLIAQGVKAEDRVGIAVERSVNMMVSLLAVLKAGGTYVPLDPDYPNERLAYIMQDSGIKILLSQHELLRQLPELTVGTTLCLDQLILCNEAVSNLDVQLHSDNLAYLIYTSGSTGKPKGVMVGHHALSNFLCSMQQTPGLTSDDTLVAVTSLSFDIAALELYLPLISGAKLVLASREDVLDGQALSQLIEKHSATVFQSTPSGWRLLLASGWQFKGDKVEGKIFKGLCGGEALPQDLAERLRSQGIDLWNMYGPTETTIWSSVKALNSNVPTLGAPIADTQFYILDNGLNPTPTGVAGELYIGGSGLARGYLSRIDLTTNVFIANPFSERGERLYRTGDLVCWNTDGELEYLGRIDHQVKIRGFRIELGEIETALLAQQSIYEAVVVAQEHQGSARLVAYVSGVAQSDVDIKQLQSGLLQTLPGYMVPSIIVSLDKLPKTPNGKVDRKALPEPEFASNNKYQAPEGEVETELAQIWSEVLGVAQVGRYDNFFELGGDSILTLQVVAIMRQSSWNISPKQVFENQTVASLASVASYDDSVNTEIQLSTNKISDYLSQKTLQKLSIKEDDFEDIYPLTSMQEGMFLHSLEAPGEGLYINQLSVDVKGLDAKRLIAAWQKIVDRHVILRTSILWNNDIERPLQLVRKSASVMVNQFDWRESHSLTEDIRRYEAKELKYNIDFFNEPLARVSLIRLDEESYQLIWTMHHLLIDGWSNTKLITEWLQAYAGKALAPVAPGFGYYVRWLEQQDSVAIESYWRKSLSRLDGPTLLADAFVNNDDSSGFNKVYLNWSEQQTNRLKGFAKQTRVTLNTVVQAAWALLLKQYTGQQQVVFGATVAGRPHNLPRVEDIFGLFINTLPVIVEPKAECLIGNYLRKLQDANAEVREYEHTPLADIQRWAGNTGKALFDSIIVFENYPIDKSLSEQLDDKLKFGKITGEGLTGYVMDLQVIIEQKLEIEFCFDRANFSEEFVLQLRQQMDLLIKQMIDNALMPVGELCLFEKQALPNLSTLHSQTAQSNVGFLPSDKLAHKIFEWHARAQPDKAALMLDDQILTYAQLNAKANILAHQLIAKGIGPDTLVAVASLRSVELIIALLAVLKAGGAYVPLDPGNPTERLNYIIVDSGAVLVLGHTSVLNNLAVPSQIETLPLDQLVLDEQRAEAGNISNPKVVIHSNNLAYVVYTSGSTGKPKGVAVAHGPLTMHCQSTADVYEMKSDWRELIFMSFSFDGAHERWLTTYSVGATLVVRGEELWTPEQTLAALTHYKVTNTTFPPAYLAQLAESAKDADEIHRLKVCVFGGEAMPKSVYDNVRAILQPDVLINGYGPTETVVTPLIWKANKEQTFETAYAPIGKVVGQRLLYVLDDNLQLVPDGVIGELYVGGQGVARGYLLQSSLTAQNFMANPFTRNGERMYRTGDLVRKLCDENIEFLGRADHQVKIRGYRIELGEVESAIRHIDSIADVAVIDKDINDNKQLVAYIVAHEQIDDERFSQSVRRQLEEKLPSYMVPSYFVVMSALPRLISGKLDRHTLPDDIQIVSRDYVAPSTPQAEEVAKIWQQVLNVKQVGETDNFFELGGDSLLSLKVISKLRSLGVDTLNFKLRDLMQRPTIAGLLGLDKKKSPLLLMNTQQKEEPALFCIHAGMGTLFDYQPLANQLQGERTLYGVPCRTFAEPSYKDLSLEQMALDYCQMIRDKQAQGPYALFGWSLGATLAAMVAALLEAADQQVEFLGLVDSFIPDVNGLSLDIWQADFVDYLTVVLPQISTADVNNALATVYSGHEQALMPDAALLEKAIKVLLSDLASQSTKQSVNESAVSDEQGLGYAAMGSDGLMEIFMMARHLKELSCQSTTLPKLKVKPHYWWVADRPESDKKALLALFEQDISQDFVLDTDHFSIIRDERLIVEVEGLLTSKHNKALKEPNTLV